MSGADLTTSEVVGDLACYRGGRGAPMVLLHGFMGTWRVWRPVLPGLTSAHAVFAPTLPGHFGSEPSAPGFVASVPGMLDVLEAQLDKEGIEQAHLVGNSLGGWLALELAQRGRALSVVALSPAGGWDRPRDLKRLARKIRAAQAISTRAGRLLRPRLKRPFVRKLVLYSVALHGERVPAKDVGEMLDEAFGCVIFEDFLAWVSGRESFPLTERADYPIRIAWSAKDRTIPLKRYGRPLIASVPGAELLIMPDVGHVPMFDNPKLVTCTILEVTTRGADPAIPTTT